MKRRELIALLGSATAGQFARRTGLTLMPLAWCSLSPPSAYAQQRMRRIGWLTTLGGIPGAWANAFKTGMREMGYVEGRNYEIVIPRGAGIDTLKPRAEELISHNVDAIIATSTPAAVVFTKLTRDIPVFIASLTDPVAAGLAASLARPGGSVTGLIGLGRELIPKRLEILRDVLPGMKVVGFVYDSNQPEEQTNLKAFEAAVQKSGLKPVAVAIALREEPNRADYLLRRIRGKVDGLILPNSPARDAWIVEPIARQKLPAIYSATESVRSGGLLSYAADVTDQFRRVAGLVDKVFKGAKPGDLPIEQPTKFEFAVNLKAAKALGIAIPHAVLLRADKVID